MQEIALDCMVAARFSPDSIDALQAAFEDYLAKLIEDSNLICIQGKRRTIWVRYLQLARRILGENDLNCALFNKILHTLIPIVNIR